MISKKLMLLRFHSHHFITPNLFPRLLSSPSFLSLHRTTTTSTAALFSSHSLSTTTTTTTTTYGPSLQKGSPPSKTPQTPFLNDALKPLQKTQNPENGDDPPPFDEDQFTRVFEIAAIRVPSERCFELEARLRGHLLNWPRISNVARVPGDEIDEETLELLVEKKVLGDEDEEEVSKAVSRRIFGRAEGDGEELSGVLYRDKLVKEFNARGFVKFRNLAKISRPKKKKKKGRCEGGSHGEEGEKGRGKRSVVVEVVEEKGSFGSGDVDFEDLSGLLGDEFTGRKWRGSTRLLLLDETCSGRNFDELPEAVKVINFDTFFKMLHY